MKKMENSIKLSKNTPLSEVLKLAPACSCSSCAHGCTMGSGCLIDSDIPIIAKHLRITEDELKQKYLETLEIFNKKVHRPKLQRSGKPYGECIFHDKTKGCTIHEVKPLQCKISMGCKPYSAELTSWFALNHILNATDPEAVRQYASFIANGGTVIDGGALDQLVPDKTMRKKMLNYEVLK